MESQNYQKIFNIISKYLPKNWKNLSLYFAFTENMISHKYYVDLGKGYIDCFHLGYDKATLRQIFFPIDNILMQERNELPKSKQWTVFTMFISSSGKFNVNYDYEDISKTFIEYEQKWEEKYIKSSISDN